MRWSFSRPNILFQRSVRGRWHFVSQKCFNRNDSTTAFLFSTQWKKWMRVYAPSGYPTTRLNKANYTAWGTAKETWLIVYTWTIGRLVIYPAPPPVDDAADRRRVFFFLLRLTTETETDWARHHADCCWHRKRSPAYDLGSSGVHREEGLKEQTHILHKVHMVLIAYVALLEFLLRFI